MLDDGKRLCRACSLLDRHPRPYRHLQCRRRQHRHGARNAVASVPVILLGSATSHRRHQELLAGRDARRRDRPDPPVRGAASAPTARPQQMALLTPGSVVAPGRSQAYGAWGRRSGDSNAAALSRSIGGFCRCRRTYGAGRIAAGRVMKAAMAVPPSASTGAVPGAGSDDYHLALYGGGQWGEVRRASRLGAIYLAPARNPPVPFAFSGFGDSASAPALPGAHRPGLRRARHASWRCRPRRW